MHRTMYRSLVVAMVTSPVVALAQDAQFHYIGHGLLNFYDVDAFLGLYLAQDPAADLLADGEFNFFDVKAFLTEFGQGCP